MDKKSAFSFVSQAITNEGDILTASPNWNKSKLVGEITALKLTPQLFPELIIKMVEFHTRNVRRALEVFIEYLRKLQIQKIVYIF